MRPLPTKKQTMKNDCLTLSQRTDSIEFGTCKDKGGGQTKAGTKTGDRQQVFRLGFGVTVLFAGV